MQVRISDHAQRNSGMSDLQQARRFAPGVGRAKYDTMKQLRSHPLHVNCACACCTSHHSDYTALLKVGAGQGGINLDPDSYELQGRPNRRERAADRGWHRGAGPGAPVRGVLAGQGAPRGGGGGAAGARARGPARPPRGPRARRPQQAPQVRHPAVTHSKDLRFELIGCGADPRAPGAPCACGGYHCAEQAILSDWLDSWAYRFSDIRSSCSCQRNLSCPCMLNVQSSCLDVMPVCRRHKAPGQARCNQPHHLSKRHYWATYAGMRATMRLARGATTRATAPTR